MGSKKYYRSLDLIRVIACIGVLLYHLKILKGGFLAVIVFFVLSGYLTCAKALKEEKFSFIKYYKTRLIRVYFPVLIVAFLTIFAVSLFPTISWLNLKPETTSVLLGYNNFWQLQANLDYFARHVSSPFMHLWYIAILLQFELVFPFIFVLLKKIRNKISKGFPVLITVALGVISAVFCYKASLSNVMVAYYNTFARVFSLFFGVALAFVDKPLVFKKLRGNISSKIMLALYLILFILAMVFVDANSNLFIPSMFVVTILTTRLISYATVEEENLNLFDKFIKYLSSISYEIYLVQYPIIFILEELEFDKSLIIPVVIGITLLISMILHFAFSFKSKKCRILKYILASLILLVTFYGAYLFIVAEDHSEEMKKLEEQLSENSKLMEKQQKEYEAKAAEEQAKWEQMMADLDGSEENLKKIVADVPSAFIGDSVMLGAEINIGKKFKNSYFNAEISRTCYVVNDILKGLIRKNALGDVIVLNFGANGDCSEGTKETIMKTVGNRKVFWLTVTNDKRVHFNNKIKAFAARYDNLYIIDWEAISKGHSGYFYGDGIHLKPDRTSNGLSGRQAYTEAIYNAIYKVYLDEFNAKKEALLKEHDELMKSKISFYGNDLLTNAYDLLKASFENASFTINGDYTYKDLKAEIEKNIEEKTISYNVVFAFDSSLKIKEEEYQELFDLLKDNKVYVINMQKDSVDFDNVTVVNFNENSKSEYFIADKVHLTDAGNKALNDKLVEVLK